MAFTSKKKHYLETVSVDVVHVPYSDKAKHLAPKDRALKWNVRFGTTLERTASSIWAAKSFVTKTWGLTMKIFI